MNTIYPAIFSLICKDVKDHFKENCCGLSENTYLDKQSICNDDSPEMVMERIQALDVPEQRQNALRPFHAKMVNKHYLMALHRLPTDEEFDAAVEERFPQNVMNSLYTSSSFVDERNLPYRDLTGKIFACVGCSSGIGFQTAISVAQTGATVYACARSDHVFEYHKRSALKSRYEEFMPWNGYGGQVNVDRKVFDRIHFNTCDLRLSTREVANSAPAYYNIDPNKSMEAFFERIWIAEGRLDGMIDMNIGPFTHTTDTRNEDVFPYPLSIPLHPLDEIAMTPNRFSSFSIDKNTSTLVPYDIIDDKRTVINHIYYGTRNIIQWTRKYMDMTDESGKPSEKIFAYVSSTWQFLRGSVLGIVSEYPAYKTWLSLQILPQLNRLGYNVMAISPPAVSCSGNLGFYDIVTYGDDIIELTKPLCPQLNASTYKPTPTLRDDDTFRADYQGLYRLSALSGGLTSEPLDGADMCVGRFESGEFPVNEVQLHEILHSAGDSLGTWSHSPIDMAMNLRHMVSFPSDYKGKEVIYYLSTLSINPLFEWDGTVDFAPRTDILRYENYFAYHEEAKEAYKRLTHAITGGDVLQSNSNLQLLERIII